MRHQLECSPAHSRHRRAQRVPPHTHTPRWAPHTRPIRHTARVSQKHRLRWGTRRGRGDSLPHTHCCTRRRCTALRTRSARYHTLQKNETRTRSVRSCQRTRGGDSDSSGHTRDANNAGAVSGVHCDASIKAQPQSLYQRVYVTVRWSFTQDETQLPLNMYTHSMRGLKDTQ